MGKLKNIDWNKYASWDLPVYLNRLNPVPLDKTTIFSSLAEAENYAKDETQMAYAGQVIAVVDVTKDSVITYKINIDRTISALATADALNVEGEMVWAIQSGNTYSEVDADGQPVTENTPNAKYVLKLKLSESVVYIADLIDLTNYLTKNEAEKTYATKLSLFNMDKTQGNLGALVILDEDE